MTTHGALEIKRRPVLWLPWYKVWPRENYSGLIKRANSFMFARNRLINNEPLPPLFVMDRKDWSFNDGPPESSRTEWVLLNGHHRYAAAVSLGRWKLPCVVSYSVHDIESPWIPWKRKPEPEFNRFQLLELD